MRSYGKIQRNFVSNPIKDGRPRNWVGGVEDGDERFLSTEQVPGIFTCCFPCSLKVQHIWMTTLFLQGEADGHGNEGSCPGSHG